MHKIDHTSKTINFWTYKPLGPFNKKSTRNVLIQTGAITKSPSHGRSRSLTFFCCFWPEEETEEEAVTASLNTGYDLTELFNHSTSFASPFLWPEFCFCGALFLAKKFSFDIFPLLEIVPFPLRPIFLAQFSIGIRTPDTDRVCCRFGCGDNINFCSLFWLRKFRAGELSSMTMGSVIYRKIHCLKCGIFYWWEFGSNFSIIIKAHNFHLF